MLGTTLSLSFDEERVRRKRLIESFLREGFGPIRVLTRKGSAVQQADRADGKASGTYARWIRDEERRRALGRDFVLPDWTLYEGPFPHDHITFPAPATNAVEPMPAPEAEVEIPEDLDARSRLLREEIVRLVSASHYPLINPDCIVVDTTMVRRFDRLEGDYVERPSTPRTWLTETPIAEPVADAAGRRFIFTAAQNDSALHDGFWRNLKAYARSIGAEIVVGPLTYETTWWNDSSTTARSYPDALEPHLCFGQLAIGDNFIFAGEMNTLATANAPISDLVTYSRNRWAVFPHGKRQLKSVASTDPKVQAHQVMTTGMVTRPKIVPRKAGVKSLFHQVIGAVVVEFDERSNIFCRQITATEDGSFYDLDARVEGGVVTWGHRARAIVFGDVHLRKLDALNSLGSFGFAPDLDARNRGSLLDVLRPEEVFLHDVFDHESRNHHHAGDAGYGYAQWVRGRDDVGEEIDDVGCFLTDLAHPERKVTVVESNHDIGLTRWVAEGRYRNDPVNAMLGLKLDLALMQHQEEAACAADRGAPAPKFSLLQHAIRMRLAGWQDVAWAYDGDSLLVDGIEVGHHGFRGANGSKGTVQGFARMGRRMTIGDKHTPEINEGVYVAGCMELVQGYNKGPSGWAIAHVVQYPDGHRTIITLQDGRWRAEKPRLSICGGGAAGAS